MMNFKRYFTLALCVPLCLSMYACTGAPSGTTSSTSSGVASSAKQDEINAAFEEAVEKLKATTSRRGTDEIEVSDPSMWSDDIVNKHYGLFETVSKLKREYKHNYEVKKDSSGQVTDDRLLNSIENLNLTVTDGTTSRNMVFNMPGDDYTYIDINSSDKVKLFTQTSYIDTDYQYHYLYLDNISNLKSTTEGSTRIFEFEMKQSLASGIFLENKASITSNSRMMYFGGKLIVEDATGAITLELTQKIENTETGHTFTKTNKSVCDNTTPELEFPDLSSYKEVGQK